MTNITGLPQINYDNIGDKYALELPPTVVERLLLDTTTTNVVILCHRDKTTLEEFSNEILEILENIEKKKRDRKNVVTWRMPIPYAILACVCLVTVYDDKIFAAIPNLRWPILISLFVFGIGSLGFILINHILPGLAGNNSSDRLKCSLGYLYIHQKIKEEFTC